MQTIKVENLVFEDQYKKSGFQSQRRYPNEALIQFLAKHFFHLSKAKRRRVRILEIGCGSGANLWMMAQEGFSVYGLDVAPTALRLCRKMLKQRHVAASLALGSMTSLPYGDDFFDAIVDVTSLQHTSVAGHRKVLQEVMRCLKKGGLFFSWHLGARSVSFLKSGGKAIDRFTVDNVRNRRVPLSNSGLTCFLSAAAATSLLRIAGFSDIVIDKYTRTYQGMSQLVEYLNMIAIKPWR